MQMGKQDEDTFRICAIFKWLMSAVLWKWVSTKRKKTRKFIIVQGPMSHMSHLTEVLASSQVIFFLLKDSYDIWHSRNTLTLSLSIIAAK